LRNKVSKTATYFSDYYNFMSELTKKLKSRIRTSSKSSNLSLYKFRRPKDLMSSKKPQKKVEEP